MNIKNIYLGIKQYFIKYKITSKKFILFFILFLTLADISTMTLGFFRLPMFPESNPMYVFSKSVIFMWIFYLPCIIFIGWLFIKYYPKIESEYMRYFYVIILIIIGISSFDGMISNLSVIEEFENLPSEKKQIIEENPEDFAPTDEERLDYFTQKHISPTVKSSIVLFLMFFIFKQFEKDIN